MHRQLWTAKRCAAKKGTFGQWSNMLGVPMVPDLQIGDEVDPWTSIGIGNRFRIIIWATKT